MTLSGILPVANNMAGQARPRVQRGRSGISIVAENATLDSILRELSRVISIESVLIEPEAKAVKVSLKLKDEPEGDILVTILESVDVNYTIWGGEGVPYRIYVGLSGDAEALPSAPEAYRTEGEVPPEDETRSPVTSPQTRPRRRTATGFARPRTHDTLSPRRPARATGSARALWPKASPYVVTVALLGAGLLFGLLLVAEPRRDDDSAS
jgi:hypothetical protein